MAEGDGDYVTLAEINWPPDWTEEERAGIISKWERYIERVCRDVFYPQDRTALLDGNGRETLPHGQNSALLEVSQLEIDGEEVSENDFSFDQWSLHLEGVPEGTPARFPEGYRNVKVVGTFGWAETPEAIRSAVRLLIERELELISEASPCPTRAAALAREQIGDYSYQRDIRAPYMTGIVEVDRLIDPYVRKGPFPASV